MIEKANSYHQLPDDVVCIIVLLFYSVIIMYSHESKYTKFITLIITEYIISYSEVIINSELLFHPIPLYHIHMQVIIIIFAFKTSSSLYFDHIIASNIPSFTS